jgi:hypothetical protein
MKTTVRAVLATIAVAGTCAVASAATGTSSVPVRADDFNRASAVEARWVSHVQQGSPRVDDFNASPASR